MDESLDGLINQLTAWKDSFYAKELWVNMSKTKILVSNPLANPSKYACGACKMGAGNYLILYHHCKSWMHHRCSNIKGHLRPDSNFKCQKCCQEREITPAPQLKHINIDNNKLEVVRSFCYLADVTSKSAGYYNATTSHIASAWKMFYGIIPIVCSKRFSLANHGHIYNSCVGSMLLYTCKTRPLNVKVYQGSQRQII